MRRALRRARDGVTLDATEASILLAARGDDLAELCAAIDANTEVAFGGPWGRRPS
jgi:hypothetical protein